jgi:tRNA nucleotidyltransferase/poly(A) polymerase
MASTVSLGCYSPVQPLGFWQSRPILRFVQDRCDAARVWLVGGCVRDWLLRRESNDIDLILPQGAIRLARSLADTFDGAFFVLDRERDVARAILTDREGNSLHVDVASLRAAELLVDLSLRDFTINAMAMPIDAVIGSEDVAVAEIIDPFGGRTDLDQGIIRAVTEGSFCDDPLRLLRAVRQAAELGFRIEDATYNLMRRDAPLLATVAVERIRDELWRILALPGTWRHLRVLSDVGLLLDCLPEVPALIGVTQSPPHYQDVFDHTRSVLAHLEGLYSLIWPAAEWGLPRVAPPDRLLYLDDAVWPDLSAAIEPFSGDLQGHLAGPVSVGRSRQDCLVWAALAHDWGKPGTRSVDQNGKIHFLEHDARGASLVQARLRTLRMATEEVSMISRLVGLHMRPGYLSHDYPPSRRAVYRFFLDAAGAGPESVLLSLADYAAIRSENTSLESEDRRIRTAGLLLEAYFRERTERVDPPRLLDGRQIMSICGLAPGPEVGLLLQELREAQASGEVTDVAGALAWLAQRMRGSAD